MAEMPDIVRSRLARKRGEIPAEHPDANLLAAFAEHTLLERERAAVVSHLMECADCRESVALAFAAAEPEGAAVAERSVGFGGWFREWRGFASAATACCVIAAALLHYGRPPAPVIVERESAKSTEVQVVDEMKPVPPPGPVMLAKKKFVAPPEESARAPVFASTRKDSGSADILTQPSPAQPAETAVVSPHIGVPKTDTASSFDAEERQAVSPKPVPAGTVAPSAQQFGAGAALGGRPPTFGTRLRDGGKMQLAMKAVAAPPRVFWSINASPEKAGAARGIVERSMDGGQSWQAVPLSERVSFRAVASFGQDVWVGGSDGALFHSSDAGRGWEQIQVADERGKLSGEVIRIDVRGPNLVTVATSTREIWVSVDGKQWVRK